MNVYWISGLWNIFVTPNYYMGISVDDWRLFQPFHSIYFLCVNSVFFTQCAPPPPYSSKKKASVFCFLPSYSFMWCSSYICIGMLWWIQYRNKTYIYFSEPSEFWEMEVHRTNGRTNLFGGLNIPVYVCSVLCCVFIHRICWKAY